MRLFSRFLPPLLTAALFFIATTVPAADTGDIPQRADIEDQYKWKVEDIYPSDEAWEEAYAGLESGYPALAEYQGRLSESAEVLAECLALRDSLELIADNLYVYAYLKLDEDNRVGAYQEMGGRISQLWSKVSGAMSFIDPELVEIGQDQVASFAAETEALGNYAHYFDNLFRKQKHVLSDKEEQLLAMAGTPLGGIGRIFSMVNDADIDYGSILDTSGNEIALTKERYYKIMESPDRDLRKRARQQYNGSYLKYENTLAACLTASVQRDYFMAQARGYETCLESSLDRYNIPTSVFHALIEAVNNNLEPLNKWTSVRKRILGYDTLHVWDLSVPMVPEARQEYTYEQGLELVTTGLDPLGDQYLRDLKSGFESGWIDVYETQGKGSGAYSWGTYSSHPYVLMNFNNTLEGVFTLAHEMGHAMHSFYTNRKEPYISHNHSLFLAEVASTGNESIMMKYMIEHTDDKKQKMALLNKYIEQIVGTFFTQVMFSEFELAIHERIESGQALSSSWMRQVYRDIYQKYWGPELYLGPDDDLGCLRIGHFYRQYYVYQYATAYAAAQMMSQKVLEDPSYVETYMEFLATGNSDYPVEILKRAGVDLTRPEAVQQTIELFASLVDEMEKLLDEPGAS